MPGTSNPASIYVVAYDADGNEIWNQRVTNVGKFGEVEALSWLALEDEIIVSAVGAQSNVTPRDSRFEVVVANWFDADLGRDAPVDGSVTLPVQYFTGYLGLSDTEDRFVLDGPFAAGTRTRVELAFDDTEFALGFRVLDQDDRPVGRVRSGRIFGFTEIDVTLRRPAKRLFFSLVDRNVRSQRKIDRYAATV